MPARIPPPVPLPIPPPVSLRIRLCLSGSACVLCVCRAIADLADRTKPRKQFNYLPLSSQKRSQAGAFEEDDLVTLDLAGEPPAAADGPADRKALRVPITWPEVRTRARARASSGWAPERAVSPPAACVDGGGGAQAVISVALYHPQRPTMKMREFLVLGSQTLAELRDKLPCITDKVLDGPMRHSGYFFIDNVFYNDLRKPENLDYSLYAVVLCVVQRRRGVWAVLTGGAHGAAGRSASGRRTRSGCAPTRTWPGSARPRWPRRAGRTCGCAPTFRTRTATRATASTP